MIRAAWNRHLENSELPRLWEHMQAESVAGQYQVTIPSRDSAPERTATVAVRFAAVTLGPTQRSKGTLFYPLPPVQLDAIYVTEVNPPECEHAIEWMLLSNMAVHSFEAAQEKLQWYSCCWQIEVFHKILQHGCKVEQCRLQSADRLNGYITLMSIVAWRLFWLTHMQRIHLTAAATTILTEVEIQTLNALEESGEDGPSTPWSVSQAVVAIAKLGGFWGRKRDGHPDSTVIWRGWSVLQNAVRLASRLLPKTCG